MIVVRLRDGRAGIVDVGEELVERANGRKFVPVWKAHREPIADREVAAGDPIAHSASRKWPELRAASR